MKYLLSFLFLYLTTITLYAGDFESKVVSKNEQGNLVYENVVEVDNTTKQELYRKVKTWVMENVKTVDNNIQFDDANAESIITTPTITLPDFKNKQVTNQKVNFKLKLAFKDNKYKITASSFVYYGEDVQMRIFNGPLEDLKITRILPNPVNKIEELFDENFRAFLNALESSAKGKVNSDW